VSSKVLAISQSVPVASKITIRELQRHCARAATSDANDRTKDNTKMKECLERKPPIIGRNCISVSVAGCGPASKA
jgi:hypothetical protein